MYQYIFSILQLIGLGMSVYRVYGTVISIFDVVLFIGCSAGSIVICKLTAILGVFAGFIVWILGFGFTGSFILSNVGGISRFLTTHCTLCHALTTYSSLSTRSMSIRTHGYHFSYR